MRIDREEIHENKIVCSNTMQITLDDDFNVPDSKADIETIVKERGSVHIDTVKAVATGQKSQAEWILRCCMRAVKAVKNPCFRLK